MYANAQHSFVVCCVYYSSLPPSLLSVKQRSQLKTYDRWVPLVSLFVSLSLSFSLSPAAKPDNCLGGWIPVHSYTNLLPEEFASQSLFCRVPQSTAVLVEQRRSWMPKAGTWLVKKRKKKKLGWLPTRGQCKCYSFLAYRVNSGSIETNFLSL